MSSYYAQIVVLRTSVLAILYHSDVSIKTFLQDQYQDFDLVWSMAYALLCLYALIKQLRCDYVSEPCNRQQERIHHQEAGRRSKASYDEQSTSRVKLERYLHHSYLTHSSALHHCVTSHNVHGHLRCYFHFKLMRHIGLLSYFSV